MAAAMVRSPVKPFRATYRFASPNQSHRPNRPEMVAGGSALRRGVPSLRFDQPATPDLACAGPARLAVRGDGSIVVAISTTREASMPTYDYGCERCGLFTETRPMAEFALPQPCPNCGDLATRALTSPAIGAGAREASFAAPGSAHLGGCRCCAAQVGSAPSRCEPGATTRQIVSRLRPRYRCHG